MGATTRPRLAGVEKDSIAHVTRLLMDEAARLADELAGASSLCLAYASMAGALERLAQ